MGREIRKVRYLSEISSVRELRQARRELEIREWFARERLIEDTYATFSLENLLSIVAPPGSVIDRVIGGVGTGFSVVQAVIGAIGSMIGGRASRSRTVSRPTKRHTAPAKHRAAAAEPYHSAPARKKSTSTRTVAARTTSAATSRPATRKRSPEIEVEVELEEKRPRRTGSTASTGRTKK